MICYTLRNKGERLMARYHKEVCFPEEYERDLEILTNELNNKDFRFSEHCLDNLKYRAIDIENLLRYIKTLELKKEWIFEYYTYKDEITKICYRVEYELYDFILVLTNQKKIVTIYINSKEDKHETLNKEIYTR